MENIENQRIKILFEDQLNSERVQSKSDFARKCGISPQKFTEILSNRMGLTVETVKTIADAFNVNIEWIINGEGEMYRSSVKVNIKRHLDKKNGIPLMPENAIAGKNVSDVQIMDYDIEKFFHIPVLQEPADFVWQITGNSMHPNYEDKGFVACKKIDSKQLKYDKVYLISVNHSPMLKRILPSTLKGQLLCRSDNKDYSDFEVLKEDITDIAKVVAYIRLD